MKAVIVIDVDEEDIGREVNYISVKGGGMSYIVGAKDSQVLIRSLPNKKEIDNPDGYYDLSQLLYEGWNYCIDTITGEKDGL